MKTISQSHNRRVKFSGMEEGRAIIIEQLAYHRPGYGRSQWEKSIVALTPDELRAILAEMEKLEKERVYELRMNKEPRQVKIVQRAGHWFVSYVTRTRGQHYDWNKYAQVPFAVLIYSAVTGWIESARPSGPGEAWHKYEAMDSPRKMLLNYGSILAEKPTEQD